MNEDVCEHGEEWSCCSECGCYCEQHASLPQSVPSPAGADLAVAGRIVTALVGCRIEINATSSSVVHEPGCIHQQGPRWFIA